MSKDKNWVRVSALRAACASGIPYRSSVGHTEAQDDAIHMERIIDRASDFEEWLTRPDDESAIAEANMVADVGGELSEADHDEALNEWTEYPRHVVEVIHNAPDALLRAELNRRHSVASTPDVPAVAIVTSDRQPFFDNVEGVSSTTTIYVKCTNCLWRLRTANSPESDGELSGFARQMFDQHVCSQHPYHSIPDRS